MNITNLPNRDEYAAALLDSTGFPEAVDLMEAAAAAARPLSGAERAKVCCGLCRLAGLLMDAARAAKKFGEDPDTITRAEAAAYELLRMVNQINEWGEGEAE